MVINFELFRMPLSLVPSEFLEAQVYILFSDC